MENRESNQEIIARAAAQSGVMIAGWGKIARRRRIYRAGLYTALTISVFFLLGALFYGLDSRIPSTIYLRAGCAQEINLGIPATGEIRAVAGGQESNIPKGAVTIDLSLPVQMQTGNIRAFDMKVCLFGFLPVKQVDIRVIEDQELIPIGSPVGIYMKSSGVLVVGTASFENMDGIMVEPAKGLLKSGDYIHAVNGISVNTKEELINKIEGASGEELTLTVLRDEKQILVLLKPEKNTSGSYKAGIWVRDNVQGVGTLTYIDGQGHFGALGHGIADADTGLVMDVEGGTLYETEIIDMRKGTHGNPGEMTGRIVYAEQFILGEILENSNRGIFGVCNDKGCELRSRDPLPIALKEEINLGPAQILSSVGSTPRYYSVEITKVHLSHDNVNRGIELKVTDPELLEATGGIVQGM